MKKLPLQTQSSPTATRRFTVSPFMDNEAEISPVFTLKSFEKVMPIWKDGLYDNPWNTWRDPSFSSVMKLLWDDFSFGFSLPYNDSFLFLGTGRLSVEERDRVIPVVKPDTNRLNSPPVDDVQVTWIGWRVGVGSLLGHASCLVQMEGVCFLTDPVWCERASPVSFFGPKRTRKVPLAIVTNGDESQIKWSVVVSDSLEGRAVSSVTREKDSLLFSNDTPTAPLTKLSTQGNQTSALLMSSTPLCE